MDETILRKKINVLFDGSYSGVDQSTSGKSLDRTRMNAVEAREEIIKWGETEFGLSSVEKQMITEIYEEIDERADPTFSQEELFKHLRDISVTQTKTTTEGKRPSLLQFS